MAPPRRINGFIDSAGGFGDPRPKDAVTLQSLLLHPVRRPGKQEKSIDLDQSNQKAKLISKQKQ